MLVVPFQSSKNKLAVTLRPLVADLTIDKKTGICTTIELGTRIAGIVIHMIALFVYNVHCVAYL